MASELVLLVPLAPEPIPGELEEGPRKGTSLDLPDCGARSHVLGEAFDDPLSPGHGSWTAVPSPWASCSAGTLADQPCLCVCIGLVSISSPHVVFEFHSRFQLITQQARKSFGLSGAQDRVSNDTLCNLGDSLHFWSCRPHL